MTHSQIDTFTDDFDDGTMDTTWNGEYHNLWTTENTETFALTEGDGVLTINYSRDEDTEPWDVFWFDPPENINVSANPHVTLKIRSDVETRYSLKPIYSNGNNRLIGKRVPADGEWHRYHFKLLESNYKGAYLTRMYMYFDGGSDEHSSGTIHFDDLKISAFSISIDGLQLKLVDSTHVDLSWSVSDKEKKATDYFNVYRSKSSEFYASDSTKIGDTKNTTFRDGNLQTYTTYYYKVSAVDTTGMEHFPSTVKKIRTYSKGEAPEISVISINSNKIGKYEKFELKLNLDKASYENPYNPEQIDVHAWFRSPSGDTTWINGFYDNYQDRDQWKLRFAPSVSGSWEYQVLVSDLGGKGKGEKRTFDVVESEHGGWLKTSEEYPHYFSYDDGRSYYGVGVYSPTGNSISRLDTLKEHDANLFAIWNINYGGFLNGYGLFENRLGQYNQEKAGRLDSLVSMLERRDIKMMYCIWPHDLFSETVWYTQWHNNPYNELINVENVYSDSLVWQYQKRQYRYLIARYGHSRSLGIWEIINELNGTDGWQNGKTVEALHWVKKVHRYFKNNDPYNHPTTANFSGGYQQYRPPIHESVDVPNLHVYPKQSWPKQYDDDDIRSSYYNYGWAARRFWKNFNKPAIFGESGASHTYVEPGTEDYSLMYHNAIWASLTNGLAATPVWWSYRRLTSRDWNHLKYLREFTSNLPFGRAGFTLSEVWASNSDAYGMAADSIGFGWLRNINKNSVSETEVSIKGLSNGSYRNIWYDTWTGDSVRVDTNVSALGVVKTKVPRLSNERKDIAYSTEMIENAEEASRLNVFIKEDSIDSGTDTAYSIIAYISDREGRLARISDKKVHFSLEGPGGLSDTTSQTSGGIASVEYRIESGMTGDLSIKVSSDNLTSAKIEGITLTGIDKDKNRSSIPEGYKLRQNYPNPFNPSTQITYSIPKQTKVTLKVFNIAGKLLETLVDQEQSAGNFTATFRAKNLASAVYIYRLKTGEFTATKRMTLIK